MDLEIAFKEVQFYRDRRRGSEHSLMLWKLREWSVCCSLPCSGLLIRVLDERDMVLVGKCWGRGGGLCGGVEEEKGLEMDRTSRYSRTMDLIFLVPNCLLT